MSEIKRIHDQLRRSYEGAAWHGPSVRELLDGVTAEQASRRGGDTHNIRELIRHIAAWEAAATRTLGGAAHVDLPPEQDWPPERESFDAEREHLEKTHRELEAAVQAFPDSLLNENVNGDRGYSYYFLLHGVVQHNLYHAGQIAILKKALA